MSERRWKRVRLGDSAMLGLFQTIPVMDGLREGDIIGCLKMQEPVPSSARVTRVSYNIEAQALELIIEDKSFDPVPECEVIPYFGDLIFTHTAFRCVDVKKQLYEIVS